MTPALLLEITLKSTLVLAVTWLAVRFMTGTSAALRHLIWAAAFFSLLILPVVVLQGPAWPVAPLPERWTPHNEMASPVSTAALHAPVAPAILTGAAASVRPSTPQKITLAAPLSPPPALPFVNPATLLINLWALGAVLFALRLVLGFIRVTAIARQATKLTNKKWLSITAEVSAALNLRGPVEILKSGRTVVASTFGLFRPRVFVPADAEKWEPQRIRLVLLHELAHAKRRDCLVQTIARLAWSLYWFNPLARIAAARLSVEQERACDDMVLAAGGGAPEYASELLKMVRVYRSGSLPEWATLAMARPSQFTERFAAILDKGRRRQPVSRLACTVVILIACLAIAPLGAIKLVAAAAPAGVRTQAAASTKPASGIGDTEGHQAAPFGEPPMKANPIAPATTQSTLPSVPILPELPHRAPAFFPGGQVGPNLVWVRASVSDQQGRLVTGLDAKDFQLSEDKTEQRIQSFSEPSAPLSLGLITTDLSGKTAGELATLVKTNGSGSEYFLIHLTHQLSGALFDFTNDASELQKYTTAGTSSRGTAPVLDTIYLGINQMAKAHNVRKVLVLITDNQDNSRYDWANVKDFAAQQGVDIFAVGIGLSKSDQTILEDVVADSPGRAFFLDTAGELSDTLAKIHIALASEYVLGYQSTNTGRRGNWREIGVAVNPPQGLARLSVRYTDGYYEPKAPEMPPILAAMAQASAAGFAPQTPKNDPNGIWQSASGAEYRLQLSGNDLHVELVTGSNPRYRSYQVTLTNSASGVNTYTGSGSFVATVKVNGEDRNCSYDTTWQLTVIGPDRIVGATSDIVPDSSSCNVKERHDPNLADGAGGATLDLRSISKTNK